MKIISYNIQFGRGLDGVVDLVRIANRVRGADLVCLQEVDRYWRRSGDTDQAAEIAGLLPTLYYVYGSSFDVDASGRAAHGAVVNRRRQHGNMVLSRWPIASSRCFNLPKRDFADKFNMHMGFLETVVDTPGGPLRVYSYHAGYLDAAERLSQVDEFAKIFNRSPGERGAWSGKGDIDGDDWSNGRTAPGMPESAIVCGDFNANSESAEYRALLDGTGLVDCWAQADPAAINRATTKREISADIRVSGKIDHVLLSADLAPRILRVDIDRVADGSDHTPITVELDP